MDLSKFRSRVHFVKRTSEIERRDLVTKKPRLRVRLEDGSAGEARSKILSFPAWRNPPADSARPFRISVKANRHGRRAFSVKAAEPGSALSIEDLAPQSAGGSACVLGSPEPSWYGSGTASPSASLVLDRGFAWNGTELRLP